MYASLSWAASERRLAASADSAWFSCEILLSWYSCRCESTSCLRSASGDSSIVGVLRPVTSRVREPASTLLVPRMASSSPCSDAVWALILTFSSL